MNENIEVTGVVCMTAPVGEYDRRLVLITRELGKITAFAPGARKPTSHLLAASRQFTFAKFTLYEGKTAYRVVSAEIVHSFDEMTKDYSALTYGSYLLELSLHFTEENVEAADVVNLIYMSLKALLNPALENRLIKCIFELRILAITGEAPQVFSCVSCGKPITEGIWILKKHGIGCAECYQKTSTDLYLSQAAVYAMQYIETAPLNKLYTFTLNMDVYVQVDDAIRKYYTYYVNHVFKSLQMIVE